MLRAGLAFIAAWLLLGPSAAQADYWGRWDRVGGGWTTNWIRHPGNANVCGHGAAGCSCFGRNYCGRYPNGAVTTWWPYGCGNPTVWRIRCTIRPIAQPGAADCRNYAATAVQQNNENLRRRCGYAGGRWQSNYQAHYNWCVAVSPALRASEDQARRVGLAQCGRSAADCNNYTNTAMSQQSDNLRRRCGYTGGRWHHNRAGHYQWCLHASPAVRAGETQARQQALAQCGRAQGGPIGILSAIYGQNCPHSNQDPRYPGQKNVTGHVARACNGRSQCTYTVNHRVIGDPAYGCTKDFRIQYRCGNVTKQAFVHPEASGRSAFLSCP